MKAMMIQAKTKLLLDAIRLNNEAAVGSSLRCVDVASCTVRLRRALDSVKQCLDFDRTLRGPLRLNEKRKEQLHVLACRRGAGRVKQEREMDPSRIVQDSAGSDDRMINMESSGLVLPSAPVSPRPLSSSTSSFFQEVLPARGGDLVTFRKLLYFAPEFIDSLVCSHAEAKPIPPVAVVIATCVILLNMATVVHHQHQSTGSSSLLVARSLASARHLYGSVIQLLFTCPKPDNLRPLFLDLSILAWNNVLQVTVEQGDFDQATKAATVLQRLCQTRIMLQQQNQRPLNTIVPGTQRWTFLMDERMFTEIATAANVALKVPQRSTLFSSSNCAAPAA